MPTCSGSVGVVSAKRCAPVLIGLLIAALSCSSVSGFRKISFNNSQRCSARGGYCTTNEQCCDSDAGVECVTLSGVGQCLSDRDRTIVFEYPCEATESCMEGYCCVASGNYRRSRTRRCKPKQTDDTVCHEQHMDEVYHSYTRVGKGKRHTEARYNRYGR